MSTEQTGIEDMDPTGVQNDGEPVAVVDPKPEDAPETKPKPEEAPEPERTPEEIEEHKRLTGSARAKAKAERLAEENRLLKERLDRIEKQVEPKETAKPVAQDSGEPVLENFETFAEYNKAAIRYEAQKIVQEERAKEQHSKVMESWEAKKAAARAAYADFDEALADMETPSAVAGAIMSKSEHTADIAYYLANHPDELKKINRMDPPETALAIGVLAASFAKPKTTPKKESKAPPPLVPVKAAAVPVKNSRFDGIEDF